MLLPEMATRRFDTDKLADDIDSRGWLPTDLARAAGLSNMTVTRVLRGERENPRTWAQLAKAMGYSVRRYLITRRRERVA